MTLSKSNFEALLHVHGVDRCMAWAETCLDSLQLIADWLGEEEHGVGFFHSPTIELAAWAISNYDLPGSFQRLGDMEGIRFSSECPGAEISIVGRIDVEPLSHKELEEAGLAPE